MNLFFCIFINVFTVHVCLKCRHNVNTGILWIQEYYEYRHVMNAEILWIQEYYEYRNNMNAEKLWIKKYYECRHVNYNYRRIINTNIL